MCCGNAVEVLSRDAALSRRLDTAVINLSNRSSAGFECVTETQGMRLLSEKQSRLQTLKSTFEGE
jgi:hypothetical protein